MKQGFSAAGTDPDTGKPVFQRFVFDATKFAAVTEEVITGTALVDNIELAATDYVGSATATSATVSNVVLSGNILFDTSNSRIIADRDGSGGLSHFDYVYSSGSSTYAVYQYTNTVSYNSWDFAHVFPNPCLSTWS